MDFLKSKLKFKIFLITKLPLAWVAGLRIDKFDTTSCVVGIKYSFWNTNPFKSMYFAAQAMAAEMSTGALVLHTVYNSSLSISTLVLGLEAKFLKKAVGQIRFICDEGEYIEQQIKNAISENKAVVFDTYSRGYNENNEIVAEFKITWTVKRK